MFGIKRDALDALFSEYIRTRDNWTCQVCGKKFDPDDGNSRKGLHCAHCFSRATKQTRWDESNAVAMCGWCHSNPRNENAMDSNVKEKYKWFRGRLGDTAFDIMEFRFRNAGKFTKPDKYSLKRVFADELKKLKQKNEGAILGKH